MADNSQDVDSASGSWGTKKNTPTDTKTFSDQLSSAFGSPVKKASGGMIEDDEKPLDIEPASHEEAGDPLDIEPATDEEMNDDHDKSISGQIMRKKMAFGGKAEDDMEPAMPKDKPAPSEDADEHYASIADAILAKKRMADGGVVDIDENAEEEPNNLDDLNYEALKKEDYSEADAISSQPEESNEHGDDLDDEDKHDMVEAIRKKIKSKRGM